MNNGFDENSATIVLTDEEGKEIEFEFIDSFDFEGNTYYALFPIDAGEEGEYVILKLEKDENGEDMLSTIDDDDEFDRVADYFEDKYLSEIDYDEE